MTAELVMLGWVVVWRGVALVADRWAGKVSQLPAQSVDNGGK